MAAGSASTQNPVVYWKFNEASGTTAQDSGYDSALTAQGLDYANLPTVMKNESASTFISWWDLGETSGTRYDAGGLSTTIMASSQNPSTFGNATTLTATVTPTSATGSVTFKDGSTTIGTCTLSSGSCTAATSALGAGSHSLTAVYAGNSSYLTSTSSPLTQTINQASSSTVLVSGTNPSTYGNPITLTGTDTDEGVTLEFATTTSPADGTLSLISGNQVTYTPNANFSGVDSFSFVADNGGEATSSPATATIHVTNPQVNTDNNGETGGGNSGQFQHSGNGNGNGGNGDNAGNGNGGNNGGHGKVLGASAYNFTKTLSTGSTGQDVTQLQLILIVDGYLNISTPTGYFGAATKAAVKKYQTANGITPVNGIVGPKTRAVLNLGTG